MLVNKRTKLLALTLHSSGNRAFTADKYCDVFSIISTVLCVVLENVEDFWIFINQVTNIIVHNKHWLVILGFVHFTSIIEGSHKTSQFRSFRFTCKKENKNQITV